jgi:hypothetical protein
MRLVEFSSTVADDVETVLRNLQGQVNARPEMGAPPPITYQELSSLLNPLGYGNMNYDAFDAIVKQMKKSSPDTFDELVSNYDENGVTLNTKAENPTAKLTTTGSSGKSVDQMAHNVVAKELS